MTVFFDNRSALLNRSTGWERYARELHAALSTATANIAACDTAAESLPARLRSDWVDVPLRVRSTNVSHFPSFPPSWASRRAGKHIIYTLHDLTWWRHPELASLGGRHYYRRLATHAARFADVLVVDSNAVRAEALEYFQLDPDRVVTVYPGVRRPEVVRPEVRARPYLLAVGTLEPRKNLQRLVRAYEQSDLRRDFDLLVVGRSGWGHALVGAEILADVADDRLWALYAGASAVVAPSFYEGFGLPPVEAFSVGTPVACSDIPVFREVTGGLAHYFDPVAEDDMVAAILQAVSLDRVATSRQLGAVAERYTWGEAASRLLDLYRAGGATGLTGVDC